MTPEIILGPPGCGKTTALLGLVEESLAGGMPPDRIGFLSFTRRATEVARSRAMERFGLDRGQLPYFRTLHSLCFGMLGMSSSDVLDGRRLQEFGDWIRVPMTGYASMNEGSTQGFALGDRCLFMDNSARIQCRPLRSVYDEGDDGIPWAVLERVSRGLREYKEARGLRDYTDMLQMFADGGQGVGLRELYVDEAQDLSELQWRVIVRLAEGAQRVVIAGDDDQAIYRWAGAAVRKFIDMPGPTRVLSQSWRVPIIVQELSNTVIQRVHHRRPKEWLPRLDQGAVIRVQDVGDADTSSGGTLILARNSCFLRDVADGLHRDGILYELHGASSVRPSLLSAVVDWEALRAGRSVSVRRALLVYDQLAAGSGVARGFKSLPGHDPDAQVSMSDLRARGGLMRDDIWHEAFERTPLKERAYLLRALKRGERLRERPRIRLSTIHGAKGGEADHVVLIRDMAWRSLQQMWAQPEDEARVWYVAVTRARERLTIVAPRTRRSYEL